MGTYGTFSGAVRWWDAANQKGHIMLLKDGEIVSLLNEDGWSAGATAYDTGVGWWFERPPISLAGGSPVGLLLGLTHAADTSSPGSPRVFIGNSAGNKLLWDGTNLVIVGTIYATAGEFTGTVNWGGGYGVLNTTGFSWTIDSDDRVTVDTVDHGSGVHYLQIISNTAGAHPALFWNKYDVDGTIAGAVSVALFAYHTGSNGLGVRGDGRRFGVHGSAAPDAGTVAPSAGVFGAGGGNIGVAGANIASGTSNFAAHFEMFLLGSTSSVLRVMAGHMGNLGSVGAASRENSGNFIEFAGKSETTSPLTRNMVLESDVTTATRAGWLRVRLDDSNSRITLGSYFIPVYTLA